MPPQTRRPRPSVQAPRPVEVSPPVVPIPPEIPAPPDPEPAAAPEVTPEVQPEPVEPPPFDPDDPQPGQSIRAFVPHSGYSSFAYGRRSFEVDPDTDCIVRELV